MAGGDRTAFDRFSGRYREVLASTLRPFCVSPDDFVVDKAERVLALAGSLPPAHVLDVGCGVGLLTEALARAIPQSRVTGLDVSAPSVAAAAARCAALTNVTFHHYGDGRFPDGVEPADLVVVANVLHHVEASDRPRFWETVVMRGLRPGGRVIVFEHNPVNPLTRYVVKHCPFDEGAELLPPRAVTALLAASGIRVLLRRYIVFCPSRRRSVRAAEAALGWLPLGAQYVVVGNRPGLFSV